MMRHCSTAGIQEAGIADAQRLVPQSAFFDPEAFATAGDGEGLVEDGETLRFGLMALRTSHALAELVAHASGIDSRIDLSKVRAADVWTNAMFSRDFGATFHALCRGLGAARFVAVLVAEFAAAPEKI